MRRWGELVVYIYVPSCVLGCLWIPQSYRHACGIELSVWKLSGIWCTVKSSCMCRDTMRLCSISSPCSGGFPRRVCVRRNLVWLATAAAAAQAHRRKLITIRASNAEHICQVNVVLCSHAVSCRRTCCNTVRRCFQVWGYCVGVFHRLRTL